MFVFPPEVRMNCTIDTDVCLIDCLDDCLPLGYLLTAPFLKNS